MNENKVPYNSEERFSLFVATNVISVTDGVCLTLGFYI